MIIDMLIYLYGADVALNLGRLKHNKARRVRDKNTRSRDVTGLINLSPLTFFVGSLHCVPFLVTS